MSQANARPKSSSMCGTRTCRSRWRAVGLVGSLGLVELGLSSCSLSKNYLGTQHLGEQPEPTSAALDAGPTAISAQPTLMLDAGTSNSPPSVSVSVSAGVSALPEAGPPVDVGPPLDSGLPHSPLPNHFVDELGVEPQEVDARIDAIYRQLFHGTENQVVYYEVNADEAYIYDVLHGDTRMDALGYGMLITVLLDHAAEFDKIWRYAKNYLRLESAPYTGFFAETCATRSKNCDVPVSNIGVFYAVTSLFLAQNKWSSGGFDYGAEALQVLAEVQGKGEGTKDGDVVNLFDPVTFLPRAVPERGKLGSTPGALTPAFYDMWAERTGDPFWSRAATSARRLIAQSMHPTTGLAPSLVDGSGVPIMDFEAFDAGSYWVGFHVAVDSEWWGFDPQQPELADRLTAFFEGKPFRVSYTLDGMVRTPDPAVALQMLMGSTAAISTRASRRTYIESVWKASIPFGNVRYYDGVALLISSLFLAGKFDAY